jgi:hypothetical protein
VLINNNYAFHQPILENSLKLLSDYQGIMNKL